MNRIFLLLLLLPLLFACDKDEPTLNPFNAGGEFILRGDSYPINSALATALTDGSAPDLWSIALTGLLSTNGLQIELRSVTGDNLTPGTYNFCDDCTEIGTLIGGGITLDNDTNLIVGTLTDGTVTVEQLGNNIYRVTFDLTYFLTDSMAHESVTGEFEGAVTVV